MNFINDFAKATVTYVKKYVEDKFSTLTKKYDLEIANVKNSIENKKCDNIKNVKIENEDLIVTTEQKRINAGKVSIKKVYGGSGETFAYTNSLPMPFDLGGLKKGTSFDNTKLNHLLTKLLYGYDLPFFNFFEINIDKNLEVGYNLENLIYSASFEISNTELLKKNSIRLMHNNIILLDNLANESPIEFSILPFDTEELATITFQISAFDTLGTSFFSNFNIAIQYRIYYGEYSEDINDNNLENPLSVLRATELTSNLINNEYLFINIEDFENINGAGYRWFCYPAFFGDNYVFYDVETDISIIFDEKIELSVINEHGLHILYYCYKTTNELFNEFILKLKSIQ